MNSGGMSEQTAESPANGVVPIGNKDEKELPKLTPAEFRVYNRLAEHMDYFVHITLYLSLLYIYTDHLPAQPFPP